jgi:hypothetical protein
MTGIFDSINALIKMADDPNMASAATSIGKAAQELPADVKEIRDLLAAMLAEMKHVDETLSRLLPVHPPKWPHAEFTENGLPAVKNEEDLYGAHTDAG